MEQEIYTSNPDGASQERRIGISYNATSIFWKEDIRSQSNKKYIFKEALTFFSLGMMKCICIRTVGRGMEYG